MFWYLSFNDEHELVEVRGGLIMKQTIDYSKVLIYMSIVWFILYMIGLCTIRRRPTGSHNFGPKQD